LVDRLHKRVFDYNNIVKWKGGLTVKEKVAEVLNKVRPYLQRDGGDVELVDVDANGLVKVRLKGACGG
jgi:Fe-S cluster biogenesis protein NfuA